MSSTAEQPGTSSEPNFTIPRLSVINETNWPEYQAKGFAFYTNVPDAKALRSKGGAGWTYRNREDIDILAGEAFNEDEGRPLAYMPGIGIYVGPKQDQPSSGAGPASS